LKTAEVKQLLKISIMEKAKTKREMEYLEKTKLSQGDSGSELKKL